MKFSSASALASAMWLGNLPEKWSVRRFKQIFEFVGSPSDGEIPLLSLTRQGLVERDISSNEGQLAASYEEYPVVEAGTFVLNPMDLVGGWVARTNTRGRASGAYFSFRLRADATEAGHSPRFFEHVFQTYYRERILEPFGVGVGRSESGGGRWTLNRETLKHFPFPVPPPDEQRRIADFLDHETAKTDALIAKQEQLITTLDERRGAVISRAVTRGLLEDRPFRDSGVEWLGEIPADWDVRPCWSSFRRVKQTGFSEEELLSVYRDHGVVPKSSRDDNHNVESEDLTSYQLVRVGDMVMNKMKAWQGSIALSDHRGIVSPAYFVYRPTQEFSRKYFHYLLRSAPYVAQYNRISKGVRVGQWDLDPTYFRTTSLIVPPVEEQRRIADFLDSETARFDQLRAEGTRMNRLLAERRQALISAAVTGKLEVGV